MRKRRPVLRRRCARTLASFASWQPWRRWSGRTSYTRSAPRDTRRDSHASTPTSTPWRSMSRAEGSVLTTIPVRSKLIWHFAITFSVFRTIWRVCIILSNMHIVQVSSGTICRVCIILSLYLFTAGRPAFEYRVCLFIVDRVGRIIQQIWQEKYAFSTPLA